MGRDREREGGGGVSPRKHCSSYELDSHPQLQWDGAYSKQGPKEQTGLIVVFVGGGHTERNPNLLV